MTAFRFLMSTFLFLSFLGPGEANVFFVSGSLKSSIQLKNRSCVSIQEYSNAGFTQHVTEQGDGRLQVEIEVTLGEIMSRASFPFLGSYPNEIEKKFLTPSAEIQADSAEIQKQAERVSGSCSGMAEAVSRIFRWVAGEIAYAEEEREPQDALSVLKTRRGSCVGMANLSLAFLRALRIPAREVHGFLIVQKPAGFELVPHRYVEVYFQDVGWLFSDPASSINFVDARHIVYIKPGECGHGVGRGESWEKNEGDRGEAHDTRLPEVLSLRDEDRSYRVDVLKVQRSHVMERKNFPLQYAQAVYGTIAADSRECPETVVRLTGNKNSYETRVQRGRFFSFVDIEPGTYVLSADCPSLRGERPVLNIAPRQAIRKDIRVSSGKR